MNNTRNKRSNFKNEIIPIGVGGLDLTLQSIVSIIYDYAKSIQDLSLKLKGSTLLETSSNIWRFLKLNTTYKQDKFNFEELRTPRRLIYDKIGDCDDYSIFTASVLLNLKYNPVLDIVAFNNKPNYGHIFVTIDNIIVDAVMDKFNVIPPNITKTKKINLYYESINA